MNARFNSRGSNWALILNGAVCGRFHTRGEAMMEQARRYRLFGTWYFVEAIV